MQQRKPITEACPGHGQTLENGSLAQCTLRWILLGFGWFNVLLGFIGILVPGMPTTVFLLIALWAFSKSSARFQQWLWNHKRFGPPIQAWHCHKVIPPTAKVLAVSMMSLSIGIVAAFLAENWILPAVMASILTPVAIYIVTRASYVPAEIALRSE